MKRKRIGKIILLGLLSLSLTVALTAVGYVGVVAANAHYDEDKLQSKTHAVAILDAHGRSMNTTAEYVPIEDMPPALLNAFVATEDKRFYSHHGLDYRRMMAAMVANLRSGTFAQGASTISCQLIKNTHLSQEKTLNRKIKEAKLALELEKHHTKAEILEMYLNVIYLGSGIYGVGDAAHAFFGKAPKDLTLAECAAIAATTVNPGKYSPKLQPDNNRDRRAMVLRLMCSQGYIDEATRDSAIADEIHLAERRDDIYETYRINALDEAVRMTALDAKTLAQGYTIRTYCDPSAQHNAYNSTDCIAMGADCAIMQVDIDGNVVAYNSSFAQTENSVRRQIGSTIKPFVYASAIERDLLLPDTVLRDEPTDFGGYSPHNYHDVYHGSISARRALAVSSNVAAVKVLSYAGIDAAYDMLNRVGLPLHPQDKHLALSLGGTTYGHTMDEVATAYCCLANLGTVRPVAFVQSVTDPDGRVIYRRSDTGKRVMQQSTAYLVSDMLGECVRSGTARKLAALGLPLYAKTGTVAAGDANSDAWCIAYDGSGVTLAWAGNLGMRMDKMTNVSGGGDTAVAVRRMLSNATANPLPRPADVCTRQIDAYCLQHNETLQLASPNTPDRYRQTILCKTTTCLAESTLFEKEPTVSCRLQNKDGVVTIYLTPQPMCRYVVTFDNGFYACQIDTVDASDASEPIVLHYPQQVGWWSITPILHGKTDIVGSNYRALVL